MVEIGMNDLKEPPDQGTRKTTINAAGKHIKNITNCRSSTLLIQMPP
tara:strand:+ start:411 stop:551 length:141 start_codon:yes stop_codon:yes gene_type:complete